MSGNFSLEYERLALAVLGLLVPPPLPAPAPAPAPVLPGGSVASSLGWATAAVPLVALAFRVGRPVIPAALDAPEWGLSAVVSS